MATTAPFFKVVLPAKAAYDVERREGSAAADAEALYEGALDPNNEYKRSALEISRRSTSTLEAGMPTFKPLDPNFEARVRTSFARQEIMQTFGAKLMCVSPGVVEIELPFRDELTQQHGFLHAGVIATIGDSACGYAALSLAPVDSAVLSVEYKINLLSPATGERFMARGCVAKPGRTVTVCAGDVFALSEGNDRKLIATMLSTMMLLTEREGLVD